MKKSRNHREIIKGFQILSGYYPEIKKDSEVVCQDCKLVLVNVPTDEPASMKEKLELLGWEFGQKLDKKVWYINL